ncbi:MAG: hypothetical protein Ta2B_04460 [Termitinemataceae bacterium]|nr:MAG: hypothetical protein Ta2B_04460 [Termitinemataceae bacterium]
MNEKTVPTPEEFRQWLIDHNITQGKAADIVGVNHRTLRGWCTPANKSTSRKLPYSAWRLLNIEFEKK